MKKELQPLVLFISAILVFGTLAILGMVYNLGKSIYGCIRLKFWQGVFSFVGYWLNVLYQLWNVAKYFLMKSAVAIDLFGNVAGGEMLEDVVTAKENTLFGDGNITISASIGKLEINGGLNKRGWFLTKLLSKVLGKNHSIDAYQKELANKN